MPSFKSFCTSVSDFASAYIRKIGSVPDPRNMSQDESAAMNFTPSNVFMSASGERKSLTGGLFFKNSISNARFSSG